MSAPVPIKNSKTVLYDPEGDEEFLMEGDTISAGDDVSSKDHHLSYKVIEGPTDVPVPQLNYKVVTLHGDRVRVKPESECSKSLPSNKTMDIPNMYKEKVETVKLKPGEMQTEDELHEEMTEQQMRPARARAHVQKRLSQLLDEEDLAEVESDSSPRSSLKDGHKPERRRTSFCDIEDVVEYKTYEAAHKCNSEPFLKIERPDPITAMRAQGVHPNTIMMMQMGF
ncbi:hypothetical protein SARC_09223 [Sphaeroforma arctica JP610]|uniref:Uncharacterized protein n=1 Tax=Sphaeroforma arctica JP610 TaxID=667725 RepID=A0A0L0FNM8_9EUKA|nr:hypothetical protein SARC_09223 [Sphaeroforma arctica JP610]KNC78339.1 hypothetical protein SARC_09223 [Sphaeroforma arctica JP610]|eukprot:XP_014152241.1 hypothetical protein SARC_09223 [Sphaeroforma arctica JP610]